MPNSHSTTDRLITDGQSSERIQITLAKDLVPLLSQQLYQSPSKAIEELVVNSFDADAAECWVDVRTGRSPAVVSVADNGVGMDLDGLKDLWLIGRSPKRKDTEYQKRATRTQIGKFGIGKLAASALAHTVTYISRVDDTVRAVTVDFRDFDEQDEDLDIPVSSAAIDSDDYQKILQTTASYTSASPEWLAANKSWTVCILTNLKPTSDRLSVGKLGWVLATAMPITDDFSLRLNGAKISSSKDSAPLFRYSTNDLEPERIERLSKNAGETFTLTDGKLTGPSFPSGITFDAAVYDATLNAGKSSDLGRSYGFFIRVRNRLVNERDPMFGMSPRAFSTWNRFRATINADDLDDLLTAPREGVGESKKREIVQTLATEIFNACRARHDQILAEKFAKERKAKEIGRNPVSPRLVEVPVADVLQQYGHKGGDADNNWFYLEVPDDELGDFVRRLYEPRAGLYSYRLEDLGADGRMVLYKPDELAFVMNESHELIREYADNERSRRLLEDFVTAESMLEVYMREAGIPLSVIGSLLESRDRLIRSLAKNQSYSLKNIAFEIRAAFGDKDDLEVALVAAMRSFGFIAKHVAGAGKPDGLARYYPKPGLQKKYTLEAKSTNASAPSLSAIDFSGLIEHMKNEEADGCILVAPAYPGADDASAAERRAKEGRISCWTVEDLARVVEAAESRHLSAARIGQIIETQFAPSDVRAAVAELLAEPNGNVQEIELDILDIIDRASAQPLGASLDFAFIHGQLSVTRHGVNRTQVEDATENLARKSNGLLRIKDQDIIVLGSGNELRRRLSIPESGGRRGGNFTGSGQDEF